MTGSVRLLTVFKWRDMTIRLSSQLLLQFHIIFAYDALPKVCRTPSLSLSID